MAPDKQWSDGERERVHTNGFRRYADHVAEQQARNGPTPADPIAVLHACLGLLSALTPGGRKPVLDALDAFYGSDRP